MNYSPVIIPTLNRYSHFKKCLESLSTNSLASKTEVYIALDYPLKDAHFEGYNKIYNYLMNEFDTTCFKSLEVLVRKKNIGAYYNLINARIELFKKYDSVIISEDDNEFSSNFLEYINLALEKFKDDKRALAVCGYNHEMIVNNDNLSNYYLSIHYDAWGVGLWRDKESNIRSINKEYLLEKLLPSGCLKKFKNASIPLYFYYDVLWIIVRNRQIKFDQARFLLNYFNGTYSVYPKISKSRNHGLDCSGSEERSLGNKLIDKHINHKIDKDERFIFEGNGIPIEDIKYVDFNKIEFTTKIFVKRLIIHVYFLFVFKKFV